VNNIARTLNLRKTRKHKALEWSRKSRHQPRSESSAGGIPDEMGSIPAIEARNTRADENEENARSNHTHTESV
jgi:hypothetical protein